jgi:hypothetical protein
VFIISENKTPIYLNPVPTYKHTMNRQENAKLIKQYKPFLSYVEVMAKLSANETDYSPWSKESRDNPRLPQLEHDERKVVLAGMPNRWTTEGPQEFTKLVDSGDTEQWYKAMIWLSGAHWRLLFSEAKLSVMHMVHERHRDTLFTKERVEAGKCVYDRYARYFR